MRRGWKERWVGRWWRDKLGWGRIDWAYREVLIYKKKLIKSNQRQENFKKRGKYAPKITPGKKVYGKFGKKLFTVAFPWGILIKTWHESDTHNELTFWWFLRNSHTQSCTCSWEKTWRSGQLMSGRQATSYGPQRTQSSSSRKTSQRVTAEVQLVGFSLHQLQRDRQSTDSADTCPHLDILITLSKNNHWTQMNLGRISNTNTYLYFFLMA